MCLLLGDSEVFGQVVSLARFMNESAFSTLLTFECCSNLVYYGLWFAELSEPKDRIYSTDFEHSALTRASSVLVRDSMAIYLCLLQIGLDLELSGLHCYLGFLYSDLEHLSHWMIGN